MCGQQLGLLRRRGATLIPLSLSVSLCLALSLSVSLFLSLSLSVPVALCLSVSLCVCVSLSLCLALSLSLPARSVSLAPYSCIQAKMYVCACMRVHKYVCVCAFRASPVLNPISVLCKTWSLRARIFRRKWLLHPPPPPLLRLCSLMHLGCPFPLRSQPQTSLPRPWGSIPLSLSLPALMHIIHTTSPRTHLTVCGHVCI